MNMDFLGVGLMSLAGGVAAVAVIAALVWEAIKRLFPLRARCHDSTLRNWFGRDQIAFTELRYLLGEEDVDPIFNQPTPKMMAAIQGAATTVLEYPRRYAALYDFLTRTKDSSDASVWRSFADWRAGRAAERDGVDHARTNLNRLIQRRKGRHPNRTMEAPNGNMQTPTNESAALMARDNLERLVNRKLDAIQARCGFEWGRFNRKWVLSLAAALFAFSAALALAPKASSISIGEWLLLLLPTAITALLAVLAEETLRGISDGTGS